MTDGKTSGAAGTNTQKSGKDTPRWEAGPLFESAMALAVKHHKFQARKRDREPYLGHLLSVAGNVIEAGGSETQTAAALLHDINEDCHVEFGVIASTVSPEVADIVRKCSEPEDAPGTDRTLTWGSRKRTALEHLAASDPSDPSLLVKLADKTNNCEKTARDFKRWKRTNGTADGFWDEFNAGDSCQHWWYTGLLEAFRGKFDGTLGDTLFRRFECAVGELFGGREVTACQVSHGHGREPLQ